VTEAERVDVPADAIVARVQLGMNHGQGRSTSASEEVL